ncbi:olfactory receptor 6B2-like [Discoglossus pictus]
MENVSKISTSFVLLGLVEMESMTYLYFLLALAMHLTTMLLCTLIIFIIWSEDSLHEPMYFFICNLVFNDIFESTLFSPKIMIDLLSGTKMISLVGCLTQAFCVQAYACVEMLTFTVMAHDRYLAVGQPLRYHTLMTNGKALNCTAIIWILASVLVSIPILLTAWLPFCGQYIKNIFCDNMSLVKLACGDTTVNNISGAVGTSVLIICCLLLVIYCYIQTFLICLKISKEACQKALRTLMTHLILFSCFMVTSLFVVMRYRLNSNTLSIVSHIILSASGLIISPPLNPLVYGIRTEALKNKIIHNLKKINILH